MNNPPIFEAFIDERHFMVFNTGKMKCYMDGVECDLKESEIDALKGYLTAYPFVVYNYPAANRLPI